MWYTDLFYGYNSEKYLKNVVFKSYVDETDDIMNDVVSDYMDSPSFWGSVIKTSLNAALDLKEYYKIMSDANLGTDYNYNESLDAANVLFVQYLYKRNG